MSEAPSQQVRRALIFSGGGARGAYEAGVVRYLVEELPRALGHAPRFDVICGSSVGAIHACYMAGTAHEGPEIGSRLVDVWTSMRVEEMLPLSARDLVRLPGRLLGLRRTAEAIRKGRPPDRLYGLLDTSGLEKVVLNAIPWRSISRNVGRGLVEAVCVTATQIATGRVVNFIETARHIPRWTRDSSIVPRAARLRPTHALASAAIPMLFPAVRVEGNYYADGGLRLNTPLAPALRLGADRVLVVALRQGGESHDEVLANHRIEDYANPAFLFGKVLNALLLDHLDTDLARMHLVNEVLGHGERAYGPEFMTRINEVAEAERGLLFRRIQDLVIRPSRDLGVLAGEILQGMPPKRTRSPLLRFAARNVTDDGRSPEADLLSYLLFDGEFLAPLAELGFADARALEAELCAFFTD